MEGWRKGGSQKPPQWTMENVHLSKIFSVFKFFLRVSNLSAVFASLHPPSLHQLLCPSTPSQIYDFFNYYCFTHHTCVHKHTQR